MKYTTPKTQCTTPMTDEYLYPALSRLGAVRCEWISSLFGQVDIFKYGNQYRHDRVWFFMYSERQLLYVKLRYGTWYISDRPLIQGEVAFINRWQTVAINHGLDGVYPSRDSSKLYFPTSEVSMTRYSPTHVGLLTLHS